MKPNSTAAAACTHREVSKPVSESKRQRAQRTRADESRRRRDSDEASNGTRAETDRRPLALEAVVPEHPGEAANARREVGDDARLRRAEVRRKGGAAVEPEPAKPEEDRAEHDVGRIVGLVGEAFSAVAPTLAEVDGNGKRRGTGRDVDRCASGEVKATHDEGPAVGVPRPARDRIVNDGRPDESKHDRWAEPCAFCDGTECNHGRDGREHQLEDAERDGGNARAANRWLFQYTLETEILCGGE